MRASATVTGFDGTVLVEIARHTEYPTGGSAESPLVVVDVVGDIDTDTAPLLRVTLAQAVRHHRRVCCDLGRAGFLGAAAVNTIFAALREADDAGCVLTVRGVHGVGAYVFGVTGLADVLSRA